MKNIRFLICLALLLSMDVQTFAQHEDKAEARIWEEDIVLPTYLTGEQGRNPRFYFGKAYQGAQGRVYPYPMNEILTDERVDKSYRALFIENDYIKANIIPEFGGKLFMGLDKTNDYKFIYTQSAVKPVLIGMLGAWISGGIEWNVFHHHRATSFTPVDHVIEEHEDGRVTAWVGEIELRHRMKWRVGVVLHPDKSYLETVMVAHNRSPLIHSILYFTNAGVHSNEDYQVIFPPSTEWVTQHAKREYAGWPIAHETYNGVDFAELGRELGTDGTDISLWKNNFKQISFFAYNYEDDWMVGYDHGKKAGTAIIGDHHTSLGKKFWTTGSGDRGKVWDQILTDGDGPELELMAGGYSDNEPDYAWIQPGETKRIVQYFYPVRNMLGDIKNANKDAAVNLEIVKGKKAQMAFNTTSPRKSARVRLMAGSELLFEELIDIDPKNPYNKEFSLPKNLDINSLELSLRDSDGEELISYSPKKTSPGAFPGYRYEGDLEKGTRTPMPETAEVPRPPAQVESNEMLYLTGMRLEQFYNPSVDPMPYYEEALRRDPGDQRVNTAVGILMLKKGMYDEAKGHLTRAVERTNWNYTHGRTAEAFYYLGLAHKLTGQLDEAYDNLYYATWDKSFKSAAHYLLAEIACAKEDYKDALEHLDLSLINDAENLKARNLKSAVLRKSGKAELAIAVAMTTKSIDALDFWSRHELNLSLLKMGKTFEAGEVAKELDELMRDQKNSYLELAADYGNCGLWEEALQVVQSLIDKRIDGTSDYPLLHYYAGYANFKLGNRDKALDYFEQAALMPPDYCFPFQLEMMDVLNQAMEFNPDDSRAPFYLGNLLFDFQPEKAIGLWKRSQELGSDLPTVYRNLGRGHDKILNDPESAMTYYEKALQMNPGDARVLFELDDLYKAEQEPLQKRLDLLQGHHKAAVESGYLLPIEREIEIYVALGQYDRAIDMLGRHRFRRWEGRGNVYSSYVDAHILRGMKYLKEDQTEKALQDLDAAGKYPLSMEAAKPWTDSRFGEVLCYRAEIHKASGDDKKVRAVYKKVLDERLSKRLSTPHYYRGYALKELGRNEEARELFEGLVRKGKAQLESVESTTGMSFFAKFGDRMTRESRQAAAHYLIGLGKSGLNEMEEARQAFEKAVSLDVNHLWARVKLAEMEN